MSLFEKGLQPEIHWPPTVGGQTFMDYCTKDHWISIVQGSNPGSRLGDVLMPL